MSPAARLVPLLPAVVAACTHATTIGPKTAFRPHATAHGAYVAVHVDHLQPGKLDAFVSARKTWLDVLARHATTDGRGLYVQTGDSGFLSVRPFTSMADLDRRAPLVKEALASVDPKDLATYDAASDALLTPPHRNEIWRYDEALSFGVTDPVAALSGAAWGKMNVEEIDPTPAGEAYEAAWKDIRAALADKGYPLVRVSYWSVYGSGELISFWLAKSQVEFLHTPSVESVVTNALGRDAADALFAREKKAVLAGDSIDVIPRVDLSSKPL